jgi:hypothetical protein
MAATAVTVWVGVNQSASCQQAPARDCHAEARAMTGDTRRKFLLSCLRDGGTIDCAAGKKLCGIYCMPLYKACLKLPIIKG